MHLHGDLLGKKVFVYDPHIKCTELDFKGYINRFSRIESLRQIGDLSKRLFNSNLMFLKVGEVPYTADILVDFAYKVIKYCSDSSIQPMTNNDIKYALKMCHKLYDVGVSKKEDRNNMALLTKLAYRQFIFQQNKFLNVTRCYYIYSSLWYKVQKASGIDIMTEIEKEIGIPYELALLFTYALLGTENSFFWIYDKNTIQEISDKTGRDLTVKSHEKYVKWCSGSFDDILANTHFLTPFIPFPIIETKLKPLQHKEAVFVAISPQLLFDKLTTGLYFSLTRRFNKGDKNNLFKEIYGHVFQEYVGQLLHYYCSSWKVIPEIMYKKQGQIVHSVDWLITKDTAMVLIEVKQSSIFLEAKQRPSINLIESDLRKTVFKAIEQLDRTEKDIISKKYKELAEFAGISKFVKIVVINDPLYNANMIVKDVLKNKIRDMSFQIINIGDFETILSCQNPAESLFKIIEYKSLYYNKMDFNEYICHQYPSASTSIEFLRPI
jgi:hypothetical protein